MCMDMSMVMMIDRCMNMCMNMWMVTCVDMCMNTCMETYTDLCMDCCMDCCTNMCMDISMTTTCRNTCLHRAHRVYCRVGRVYFMHKLPNLVLELSNTLLDGLQIMCVHACV